MCGIAGFFDPKGTEPGNAEAVARGMSDAQTHRGPNDSGVWVDGHAGIALAHRRLAIIDLSPAGHQPMTASSQRYVIVFNGEIYNHLELRTALEGQGGGLSWRGHSDTETLLAAIDAWGIEKTLKACVGMFGIALWDREEKTLTLARDRLGEKPLYYGWQNGTLLFGSELKALRAHPAFGGDIDRGAAALYFRDGYISAPHSIYAGIAKLMPGTFLQFRARDGVDSQPVAQVYWSVMQSALDGFNNPFSGSATEAVDELERLLTQSVKLQCVADVPLGAFLSGGVDSTTIVALMQKLSSRPVKSFTIGFHEAGYDEASHAKKIAHYLGTEHTELYLSADDAMQLIPDLAARYDEPFGDSSAIPTGLVSRLARDHVTVSLSGDGGDELFAGYTRYPRTQQHWQSVERVPAMARPMLRKGLSMVSGVLGKTALGRKFGRAEQYYSANNLNDCYGLQLIQRHDIPALVLGYRDGMMTQPHTLPPAHENSLENMLYLDSMRYLPDDILAKVDRAAMAVSLETRVPLLDHRVVELAWRLPRSVKVRDGHSKWVLKQLLARLVPTELTERPKAGFGVPVRDWIRGPMREWAEDLLSEDRLRRGGLLDVDIVRAGWQQHLTQPRAGDERPWHLLAFQAWHDRFHDKG